MNQNAYLKTLLRKEMRAQIKLQSAIERTRASQKIAENLQAIIENLPHQCARAAIFLATPREPDVDAFARWLQARGVLVCAPRSVESKKPFVEINENWSNISHNARGWREPEYSDDSLFHHQQFSANEMDLILAPALAFDETGARLGQGGGWYDRALENLPPRILIIGVAFDFQIIQSVLHEAHDQIVSMIATEERIMKCQ